MSVHVRIFALVTTTSTSLPFLQPLVLLHVLQLCEFLLETSSASFVHRSTWYLHSIRMFSASFMLLTHPTATTSGVARRKIKEANYGEVWGHSPQQGPGAEPLGQRVRGAKPPWRWKQLIKTIITVDNWLLITCAITILTIRLLLIVIEAYNVKVNWGYTCIHDGPEKMHTVLHMIMSELLQGCKYVHIKVSVNFWRFLWEVCGYYLYVSLV